MKTKEEKIKEIMSRPKKEQYKRIGKSRILFISDKDRQVLSNYKYELKQIGVEKSPMQLYDELFRAGLYQAVVQLQNSRG
jgi:hypothetical protein